MPEKSVPQEDPPRDAFDHDGNGRETALRVRFAVRQSREHPRAYGYEQNTIGLETTVVFGAGPGHSRQAVLMVGDVMLHVFEIVGYDPTAHGHSIAMFERGRLDHIGFTVTDVPALTAARDRLIAVDASSGDIRPLGPMLSLRFSDPEGFEGEINCYNPDFDPEAVRDEDEIVDPHWLERGKQVLHAHHETRHCPAEGAS